MVMPIRPGLELAAEETLRCDGGTRLEFRFDDDAAAAFLKLPEGDEARLEQQHAESGFLYKGADYELRGSGRKATSTMEGAPRLECVLD